MPNEKDPICGIHMKDSKRINFKTDEVTTENGKAQ